jgi:hypothetical protein
VAPVMVTIRYAGDPDELFPKWERALGLRKHEFGDRFTAPDTIVARGENGKELVVVNVFRDDEAHTNFGRNLGGPLESVGLSAPALEHLDVLRIDFSCHTGMQTDDA